MKRPREAIKRSVSVKKKVNEKRERFEKNKNKKKVGNVGKWFKK